MRFEPDRAFIPAVPPPSGSRYCEQPTGWHTRLAGVSGTAVVAMLVLFAVFFTWQTARRSLAPTSPPLMVELHPLAAPPEPTRNLAPGPARVERQEPLPRSERVEPPLPTVVLSSVPSEYTSESRPENTIDPGPPVPQTTAPRSVAAPPADLLTSDARPDWEASVLAHLERFRRYPARARAARQQGVVHVRFTMNRNGMVLSSIIVRKSGSFTLDQAALDTLRRAQPLPAIPLDRSDTLELTVPIEFDLQRP